VQTFSLHNQWGCHDIQRKDTQHNETQHSNKYSVLHYAEWHYAKYRLWWVSLGELLECWLPLCCKSFNTLSFMLYVVYNECCSTKRWFAVCHYAENHSAECCIWWVSLMEVPLCWMSLMLSLFKLNIVILIVDFMCHYTESRYVVCHCAESRTCWVSFCRMSRQPNENHSNCCCCILLSSPLFKFKLNVRIHETSYESPISSMAVKSQVLILT